MSEYWDDKSNERYMKTMGELEGDELNFSKAKKFSQKTNIIVKCMSIFAIIIGIISIFFIYKYMITLFKYSQMNNQENEIKLRQAINKK